MVDAVPQMRPHRGIGARVLFDYGGYDGFAPPAGFQATRHGIRDWLLGGRSHRAGTSKYGGQVSQGRR
jgi:hypothetical protein